MSAEAVWFLSDYDNLLGVCTASSGTDCMIGEALNGDAARVTRLELQCPVCAIDVTVDMSVTDSVTVVYPGTLSYPLADKITVLPLAEVASVEFRPRV